MPEIEDHKLEKYRLQAKLPQYVRYAAIFLLCVVVLGIIVGFYRSRNDVGFRLKNEHARLSEDVISEISNFERIETADNQRKYLIRADFARTFSDQHQELQNIYLETYDENGEIKDKMSAREALYVPDKEKNFTAYLKNDVKIESGDGTIVKTPNIVYTKSTEIADADQLVEFERGNIKGHATGALVKMAERKIELLKDVEIELFDSPELRASNVRYSKINSGSAVFDQIKNVIGFGGNVAVLVNSTSSSTGKPVKTDMTAGRAAAVLVPGADDPNSPESAKVKTIELFDDVHIVSTDSGVPTNIDAGYVLFDRAGDRYELKNGAHIVTNANSKPTDIKASTIIYDQKDLKLGMSGGVEITQGGDHLTGDALDATLFPEKKLKTANVRGNARVRQTSPERTTTVSGSELTAIYGENRQLRNANAAGNSRAEFVPTQKNDYSRVALSAPRSIRVLFKGEGQMERMDTDGRTTINMDAVAGTADAANKRVTADKVTTLFNDNGKDIKHAEAVGNAEVYVEPLKPAADAYRTTINAPRFDCEFFPTGNNARLCVGGNGTKTVRVPTIPAADRGQQVIVANRLTAVFSAATKDIERLDADGTAKFTENDRNAIADQIAFTPADSVVRLRGGDPTVWDSRSRAKATELDWNTREHRSSLRGNVSTTYYTRKSMGDVLPFGSSDKPVFITAANAEFDHDAETAVYSGNARAWQDNNYVRADKLTIRQKDGKFFADGSVQSTLYDAKQTKNGKSSSVPVFASAARMDYDRNANLVRYRENVDIRQGTDRMIAEVADVYLNKENELSKTVAEKGVVITQPGRKATGDWVQYTADDELAILRGSPASVSDAVNGSTQAAVLNFHMRENRVVSEGKAKTGGTGRIRTVYNVKP